MKQERIEITVEQAKKIIGLFFPKIKTIGIKKWQTVYNRVGKAHPDKIINGNCILIGARRRYRRCLCLAGEDGTVAITIYIRETGELIYMPERVFRLISKKASEKSATPYIKIRELAK